MGRALDIEISGLANGAPVEVVGAGELDAGYVRMEIRTLRPHLTFDATLVVLGLLDALALVGNALGDSDSDTPAHIRSRTDLYDEHGREAGGWRVLAALTNEAGLLRLAGLLVDHRTHLDLGERVVAVEEPWTMITQPLGPEGVLLAGAWRGLHGPRERLPRRGRRGGRRGGHDHGAVEAGA